MKRFKSKLSHKLKLSEGAIKNIEKYPNLLTKNIENGEKAQSCRVSLVDLYKLELTGKTSFTNLRTTTIYQLLGLQYEHLHSNCHIWK